MLPGPDRIVACPHCKGLAWHGTIATGNTLGMVVWTDGYRVAPMLPSPPPVVQCAHCRTAYWLADAAEVARREPERPGPEGESIGKVVEPTEEEYYEAIARGLATDEEQRVALRVFAWWRSNDALRENDSQEMAGDTSSSARRRQNLETLAPLLDESDEAIALLKAEVLRELGRFDDAKACLSRITSRAYVGGARQLARLCDEGNTRVQRRQSGAATCPKCGGELRTPFARQCRFCGADWH